MQRSAILAVVLALLVAVGGYFAWRQITALGDQVTALGGQVEDLGQRLEQSEERAEEAEVRADRAEEDAEAALARAAEASEKERVSAERAAEAERDRQEALEREDEAAEARRLAEARADEEAAARAAAEEKRAALERREAELILKVGEAQSEARQARAEKQRLERRMLREQRRLERALGQIAETRREALGLTMTLDSSQIEFDFDKATLRPENRETLSRIAGVLLTFEDISVQVVGHTDDVGSAEYNRQLSLERAATVRDYLVEAGLDSEVLSIKGLGKGSPLVAGTDPESRQRNRRVELLIVFSEGDYEIIDPEATEEARGEAPEATPGRGRQ
jgi:outer membrane protein OmpA-like peptidoglycan-associated protein